MKLRKQSLNDIRAHCGVFITSPHVPCPSVVSLVDSSDEDRPEYNASEKENPESGSYSSKEFGEQIVFDDWVAYLSEKCYL